MTGMMGRGIGQEYPGIFSPATRGTPGTAQGESSTGSDMKKNWFGIFGVVLAIVIVPLILILPKSSPVRPYIQLDGALFILLSSVVAAIRGSRLWLLLSGVALVLVVLLMLAPTGS